MGKKEEDRDSGLMLAPLAMSMALPHQPVHGLAQATVNVWV